MRNLMLIALIVASWFFCRLMLGDEVMNRRAYLINNKSEGVLAITDALESKDDLVVTLKALWYMLCKERDASVSSWAGDAWLAIINNEFDINKFAEMTEGDYFKLVNSFLIDKLNRDKNGDCWVKAGILLRQREALSHPPELPATLPTLQQLLDRLRTQAVGRGMGVR